MLPQAPRSITRRRDDLPAFHRFLCRQILYPWTLTNPISTPQHNRSRLYPSVGLRITRLHHRQLNTIRHSRETMILHQHHRMRRLRLCRIRQRHIARELTRESGAELWGANEEVEGVARVVDLVDIENRDAVAYNTRQSHNTQRTKHRSSHTQKPSHMNRTPQRHTTKRKRQHLVRMTVHHALNARKSLIQLAVDIAFDEAFRGVRVDWAGVRDEVFDDVACVCDVGGGDVAGHEEIGDVVGVADLVVVLVGVLVRLGLREEEMGEGGE